MTGAWTGAFQHGPPVLIPPLLQADGGCQPGTDGRQLVVEVAGRVQFRDGRRDCSALLRGPRLERGTRHPDRLLKELYPSRPARELDLNAPLLQLVDQEDTWQRRMGGERLREADPRASSAPR